MRIKKIILDYLSETKLFEMAFERKIATTKARSLQNQIARHIIKVCMYSKSKYMEHWCDEINAWLNDIQDTELKGTGKPLDMDTLMKILFEEPMETINEVQRKMNKIYRIYPTLSIDEPDAGIVHNHIYMIMKSACVDIANDRFTSINRYL
jgi:hypothetical protein